MRILGADNIKHNQNNNPTKASSVILGALSKPKNQLINDLIMLC